MRCKLHFLKIYWPLSSCQNVDLSATLCNAVVGVGVGGQRGGEREGGEGGLIIGF